MWFLCKLYKLFIYKYILEPTLFNMLSYPSNFSYTRFYMVSEGRFSSTLAAVAMSPACCFVLFGTNPSVGLPPARSCSWRRCSWTLLSMWPPPRPISRMWAPSPMRWLRHLISRPRAPLAPCSPTRWFPNYSYVRSGCPPCTRIMDVHRLRTRPMVRRPVDYPGSRWSSGDSTSPLMAPTLFFKMTLVGTPSAEWCSKRNINLLPVETEGGC
jgi:hypothetical protein